MMFSIATSIQIYFKSTTDKFFELCVTFAYDTLLIANFDQNLDFETQKVPTKYH